MKYGSEFRGPDSDLLVYSDPSDAENKKKKNDNQNQKIKKENQRECRGKGGYIPTFNLALSQPAKRMWSYPLFFRRKVQQAMPVKSF